MEYKLLFITTSLLAAVLAGVLAYLRKTLANDGEKEADGKVFAKVLRFSAVMLALAVIITTVAAYTGPRKVRAEDQENKKTEGRRIDVANVDELEAAIAELKSGDEIYLADGTYYPSATIKIGGGVKDVKISGKSGDREKVILKGRGMRDQSYGGMQHVFLIAEAENVAIENMTVRDAYFHGIQIQGEQGAEAPVIRNVHFADCGEQMIKVSHDMKSAEDDRRPVSNGIVEDCLFEFDEEAGYYARWYYTCAIDAHNSAGWTVRNNTFKNIRAPRGEKMTEHTVHFWYGSKDTLIEGNTFINCDRAIGLGLFYSEKMRKKTGWTRWQHTGGIVRNNIIYRDDKDPGDKYDVGIDAGLASGFKIYNNTVILEGTYPNAIEYRGWIESGDGIPGEIYNNLCDGNIVARDGGQAEVYDNITTD